jgi:hypothetical protein
MTPQKTLELSPLRLSFFVHQSITARLISILEIKKNREKLKNQEKIVYFSQNHV